MSASDPKPTLTDMKGGKPRPDQPRDFVKEWEQKLAFQGRFAPLKNRIGECALHTLSVLKRIEKPRENSA